MRRASEKVKAILNFQPLIDGLVERGYVVTAFDPGVTFYSKDGVEDGVYQHTASLDGVAVNLVKELLSELAEKNHIIRELDDWLHDYKEQEIRNDAVCAGCKKINPKPKKSKG